MKDTGFSLKRFLPLALGAVIVPILIGWLVTLFL